MCCSPWGHKELDTTERMNWTDGGAVLATGTKLGHPHPVWSLLISFPDLELDLALEVTLLSPSQPFLGAVEEVMPSVSHSANTPECLFRPWPQMSVHPWTQEP